MDNLNTSTLQTNENMSSQIFVEHKLPKTASYSLLFLISIIGNSLIVWVTYKDHRLRSTTYLLVANMAVSDLLETFVEFPWFIISYNFNRRWLVGNNDFGLALCKLTYFFTYISTTVSMQSCFFLAIDRYYAVAHPWKSLSRYKKYIIAGIWLCSGLLVSPYLYFARLSESNAATYCKIIMIDEYAQYKIYYYFWVSLFVGINLPLITTLYILTVCKFRHRRAPGNQTDGARKRREQQNRRVLKMSVTIVGLLYLMWLPYYIVKLLREVNALNHLSRGKIDILAFVVIFIKHFVLITNFFLYIVYIDIYRDNIKAMITKCCSRLSCCGKCTRSAVQATDEQELTSIRIDQPTCSKKK